MKLIILPGLDGTGEMVSEFSTYLKLSHDVTVLKYPKNSLLTYSALTDFVLEALPYDVSYCIIAESFSGPIAARIAAKHPNGLRTLVFAASFVTKPNSLPTIVARLSDIFPANSPLMLRLAQPFTFGRWGTYNLHSLLVESTNSVSSKVLALRVREVFKVNELEAFTHIRSPLLYLRPVHDRLVSHRAVEVMCAANPAMHVSELEGPHFILQTKPNECSKIVTNFLDLLSTDRNF